MAILRLNRFLLIAQVFIRRQKDFTACRFRSVEQVAIRKAIPAPFSCLYDAMGFEMEAQGSGRTLIKKIEHRLSAWMLRGSEGSGQAPEGRG